MPKLNKQFVDKLKLVEKDTLYRDTSVIGFALRVKPSGAKAWVVQYRNGAGRGAEVGHEEQLGRHARRGAPLGEDHAGPGGCWSRPVS